jgi:hypothetical protein
MKHRPARLFREVVLDPIPASVEHIKANHARWFSKHTYVFRFDVGLEDLALILRSGPFEEISCVKYDRGMLRYGETEEGLDRDCPSPKPPSQYVSAFLPRIFGGIQNELTLEP